MINSNDQHDCLQNIGNDKYVLLGFSEAIFVSWLWGPKYQVTIDVSISFKKYTSATRFVVFEVRTSPRTMLVAKYSARFQIVESSIIFNYIPSYFAVSSSKSLNKIYVI